MREKSINVFFSKKKSISYILLCTAISLVVIAAWTIIGATTWSINISDRDLLYKLMSTFGIIGILGSSIILYFMKNTNKLNVIKMSKEELEKVYDELIDHKIIKRIQENAEEYEKEIEMSKKKTYNAIVLIIINFISVYGTILFSIRKESSIGFGFSYLVFLFTAGALWVKLREIFKTTEKLVEEFKVKSTTDILWPEVYNRNKEYIKELKIKEREDKDQKIARKNPILFWLIESILLIWCLAAFNSDILAMIQSDEIYGIIGIVVTFGIPAFFFIRNIYVRYFKQSK